ncbi:conserved hypothetical protein [Cellulophaga lytica]|nr:conserved hypothetical protein [Cellulophaga lytica]
MVSTGIKITEFPIKHLAKTFYFVLSFFIIKPNPKDLADLANKNKPLNLALYALFAIGIVVTRFIPS